MDRDKISLSVEDLQSIVYGDSYDYEVIKIDIVGTWRHGDENVAIVQRKSDKKYFKLDYRDSCKDECGFKDMNYDGEYDEVFPVERTVIVYE